jgi:hypothetical protein
MCSSISEKGQIRGHVRVALLSLKTTPFSNILKEWLFKLFERAKVGHFNRAAVSRNRYGVEKTVDTHKILINAITCYVCLHEI